MANYTGSTHLKYQCLLRTGGSKMTGSCQQWTRDTWYSQQQTRVLDREKWSCYNMWLHNRPGVPGLHILQCSRVGYWNWSSSQCSCQIDSLFKIHPCQLGQASWRSKRVVLKGPNEVPCLRCSWDVQCFQVSPKFLGVSWCIHPWCDHGSQVCSVRFKLSWCVQLSTSHPGVSIQCPSGYMPSRCVQSRCVHL